MIAYIWKFCKTTKKLSACINLHNIITGFLKTNIVYVYLTIHTSHCYICLKHPQWLSNGDQWQPSSHQVDAYTTGLCWFPDWTILENWNN